MNIVVREFYRDGDQRQFDHGIHAAKRNWAQFVANVDCLEYGMWTTPFELKFASYTNKEHCVIECDSVEEYVKMLAAYRFFAIDHGGFIGINCRGNVELQKKFAELKVDAYLINDNEPVL